ncbi:MAG: hypothetical protein WAN51_13055, partial [Alphaproteobacteria bacterium]
MTIHQNMPPQNKPPKTQPTAIFEGALASPDRLSENVRVQPIVVPELKFRDVERQVFAAHFVEGADHAAFNEGPEAFDCLSMDGTDDILALVVIDGRMRKIFVQIFVAHPLIGAEQTNFCRNGLANKFGQCRGADILDDASDHIAFALHGTGDDCFTHAASPAAPVSALVLMPVLGFAADKSLIDFDNSHELAEIFVAERGTDAMAHIPSRPVRAEAHHAMNLEGADPLLARQHEVDHAEPVAKRFIGVLENGADEMGEAVTLPLGIALVALPGPRLRGDGEYPDISTTRTGDTLGPPMADKVGTASVLVWKRLFPLSNGHLMNGFFRLPHGSDPFDLEPILPYSTGKVQHNRPKKQY